MANFFKGYGAKAYQEKHKGEVVEEIKTTKLEGYTVPSPKTLGSDKQSARDRAINGPISDENNI